MTQTTHLAAVYAGPDKPLSLTTLPIPQPTYGAAVVRILATALSPNSKARFFGTFIFGTMEEGITPGQAAIGRVHGLGPDATSLQIGDLIFTDFAITSRDNPDHTINSGFVAAEGPPATLQAAWPHNSFAQYARVPLERTWALNETHLCKELGYTFSDLSYLGSVCIAVAGLLEIGVSAGDVVVLAPATGLYGGATVPAILALGAKVVACGRNASTLKRMEGTFAVSGDTNSFQTVTLTGDPAMDLAAINQATGRKEGADFFIDYTPPTAAGNTGHIATCISALRRGGRAALMGFVEEDVGIPYGLMMTRNLHIQGQWMFERRHVVKALRLLETGAMRFGHDGCGIRVHGFTLQDIGSAIDKAAELRGWGDMVVLLP